MGDDELRGALADAGLSDSGDGGGSMPRGAVGAMHTGAGAFVGWVDVAWLGSLTRPRVNFAALSTCRGCPRIR